MDPIKVDFTGKGGNKKKEIVIPPERAAFKLIISIVGTLLISAVIYYIMLPPINPKAMEFYFFLGLVFAVFIALSAVTTKAFAKPEYIPYLKKQSVVPGIVIGVLVLVVLAGLVVSSVVFRAKSYSRLMDPNPGKFTEEIEKQNAESYASIPRLDESAAANLANKELGTLKDLGKVSQFTVYPLYTQINYQGKPVRVSTLQYASIIKWLTNRSEGLPGYIIIDMANQTTEFKETEGMKYSPSEHFGRLLKRHLRFQYPGYIFAEPTFEIDEDGKPYWICARLDKTIGLFGGTDVVGAVLVNPFDGSTASYTIEELKDKSDLKWLDRIYSSTLLVEQYDYYGKYRGGFWNSVLGQKEVQITTDGYNYLAKDDDVYLYTGVTSITSDESIIGFILINQRTKNAIFYSVEGTTENSAMSAAEGKVKDKAYTASFPLLINVSNQPTYFMALKDNNQVNQNFAMVNVEQFNKIFVVGDSLEDCLTQYLQAMKNVGIKVDIDVEDIDESNNGNGGAEDKTETVTAVIEDIRTAVKAGESVYYFKLAGKEVYYSIAASKAEAAVILNKGDTVTFTFKADDIEKAIIPLNSLKAGE